MKFEDLGDVWRQREGERERAASATELANVRARAARLERAVRRRDRLESAVALLMAPLFGWMAATAPSGVSAAGAGIVVAACLAIPVRLRLARRAHPDRAVPVADAVRAELRAIRSQERLLGSVAWWYLTPLGAGVLLFMAGSPVSVPLKLGYAAAVIALYGWILYLNLRAVQRDLRPVAREMEAWLESFNESSAHGVSNVAPHE